MAKRKKLKPSEKLKLLNINANVCCVCKTRNVGVNFHHIDHDSSNNKFDNIAILCVRDHDAHHRPSEYESNHLELKSEKISEFKQEWETFVQEARKDCPDIIAVLNVYGSYDEIHSARLLFQNSNGQIFLERVYHTLIEPMDKIVDNQLAEIAWLGADIKLAIVNEPLPIDYCPCCNASLANTINADVAKEIAAGSYNEV